MENLKLKELINNRVIKYIINELNGEVYVVGGFVRDLLLGRTSKDVDIVVRGIEIDDLIYDLSIFGNVDPVGKSFGVLKLNDGQFDFDISLPRKEKPTGDGGYHGFKIQSDPYLNIEDDLLRRDIKINAIAIKLNDRSIIDPYNGINDLQSKLISYVNRDSFMDDPLRMLRVVQFSSRFNFTIEDDTMNLIKENSHNILDITKERIIVELDKIINKCDINLAFKLLYDTNLFEYIFGFNYKNVIDFSKIRVLSELLFQISYNVISKPSEYFKNKLNISNKTYKELVALEKIHLTKINNIVECRLLFNEVYNITNNIFDFQYIPESIKNEFIKSFYITKYPKSFKELNINGNDLIELGYKGSDIGQKLKHALFDVYSDRVNNKHNELINSVKN